MEEKIASLKKKLKELLSSEDDLKKLELVKTPQDILGLMTKVGGTLTKKLEIELKTRGMDEPISDTLVKLIGLRREAIHFLKDEQQQKSINEHWEKILQKELQIVKQANEEAQEHIKEISDPDISVSALIQKLEEETASLEAIQRQQTMLPASSNAPPVPIPDKNLRAQVKKIMEDSSLWKITKILGTDSLQNEQSHKLQQLLNRQDNAINAYKSPTPFSMELKPKSKPDK